jgi:hypothetical protein
LPLLIAQHLCQIAGGPEFPRSCPLPPRDLQGLAVAVFSRVTALHAQEQSGADAVQLGIEEPAPRFPCPCQGLLDDLQALLGRTPAAIGPRQHTVVQRARKAGLRMSTLVLHLLRVVI